jgi:hypothetical protein
MGPFPLLIRSWFIVLACLTVVAGTVRPDIWAQAADPQALVGKWEGTWKVIAHPDITSDYNMSVTKVVGNQVYGRAERRLTTGRITMADFVGTLEGDHLTYGDAISSTELTISGNQIRGTSIENFKLAIEMTRAK